ncbi:MAG: cyclic beta 1-2 glucan synthetase, partial [Deltaproteobacteria bacterium]|nr:cyclic beta 1-2 glucan synthetase [Deltaproteobacteria bacterium]
RFLANRDANLAFALVSDFRDASEEHLDGDAALLARATAAIEALNLKYPDPAAGGGFFLLHRARRWNPSEGVWMGWERKRGKLEDLNAMLRGEPDHFATVVGPVARLREVQFVIVLDSDTELPRDSARDLAGTLAHPLNRALLDPARGRVTDGYAILQPRVGITLASANGSRFARLFSGEPGIDPYTRAVSDVYQDVFGEGSFIGKGIYDVDAVRASMSGRLPENRILSHDLLEGAYGRAGLVCDVMVFEDYPAAYAADVSRRARWIRGDWQIARWLFRRVPGGSGRLKNPISRLSQWKILDNLRRSLVPIAIVAVLVIGWLVPAALVPALLVVGVTLVLPGLLSAAASVVRRPTEVPRGAHLAEVARNAGRQLARDGFALATVPYDALISLTSIARAAARVLVTRKHLLEWKTAADAHRSARTDLGGTYASMWIAPLAAAGIATGLGIHDPGMLLFAVPVLALWTAAPALVWWASQPLETTRSHLATADTRFLRTIARRTWRFFETFVGAEDHDLPPDNVQEDPPVGVAHRTSPTNIGLSLLANLAAYDIGYVSANQVIARTTRTLATMARMQRYRGHFYNWYDTRTLEPLRPMYVSAVDSGNLAGHLLTLASGLQELAGHRIVRVELFAGFADTLAILAELGVDPSKLATARELAEEVPATLPKLRDALASLVAAARELVLDLDTAGDAELTSWAHAFEQQCVGAASELAHLAPWVA